MIRHAGVVAFLLSIWLLFFVPCRAAPQPSDNEPSDFDFRCCLGTSALLGAAMPVGPGPLVDLALLQAGDELHCWTLIDTANVRPFPDAWRAWIRDDQPILKDPLELEAFNQTLRLAHWTDADALYAAAREDLTFQQLFRQPERYRGQIVRIQGRMRRITREELADNPTMNDDPMRPTAGEMEIARQGGIRYVYEGWLFNADFEAKPICCLFTRLPPGLRIAQNLNQAMTFAGYFFKRYRYQSSDPSKATAWREAPLLIGQIVEFGLPDNVSTSDSWSSLITAFLSFLAIIAVFVIGLTWWFRREDVRVRKRLAALRAGWSAENGDDQSGNSTTPIDISDR